jgi:peptide/nickel transport system substrate-binding protein/oligopeptide transport system substrate-binding protein
MVLLSSCTSKGKSTSTPTPSAGERGGTFSVAWGEPNYMTPQRNYEAYGSQAFQALFDRLMTFDDSGNLVGQQAQSVTSDDQKVWTIEIKPGWTFHDGTPVTAQDYVNAWNWTALGSNEAILNFFFERIEGYADLNPEKGKATTKELSGLKVIDDTTFEVTLDAPFSQFPLQLSFDAFDPLPKAFFDDPDAYDDKPIGDGPYMMDGKWQHNQEVDLKRYPDYAGTPGSLDEIKLVEYNAVDPAYADLQAGNIDWDLIGSDKLLSARKEFPDTLQEHTGATLLYLSLPLYDDRFKNKLVRQALSLAVDREAVMRAVLVAETPADAFVTPGIDGYRQGACTYCHLDVDLAKQKLEQAGGFDGPITINLYTDQTLEQAMEAVGNQWRQNLGIDFKINTININSYFDETAGQKLEGPWWDGWTNDYPSMEDFLRPIFGATGGYNLSTYSNPEFDQILKEGDRASTVEDSITTWQKAEDILAEDMPVIPWGFIGFNFATSDNITNVLKDGPFDQIDLRLVQVVK